MEFSEKDNNTTDIGVDSEACCDHPPYKELSEKYMKQIYKEQEDFAATIAEYTKRYTTVVQEVEQLKSKNNEVNIYLRKCENEKLQFAAVAVTKSKELEEIHSRVHELRQIVDIRETEILKLTKTINVLQEENFNLNEKLENDWSSKTQMSAENTANENDETYITKFDVSEKSEEDVFKTKEELYISKPRRDVSNKEMCMEGKQIQDETFKVTLAEVQERNKELMIKNNSLIVNQQSYVKQLPNLLQQTADLRNSLREAHTMQSNINITYANLFKEMERLKEACQIKDQMLARQSEVNEKNLQFINDISSKLKWKTQTEKQLLQKFENGKNMFGGSGWSRFFKKRSRKSLFIDELFVLFTDNMLDKYQNSKADKKD